MKCRLCKFDTASWPALRGHYYDAHGDPVPRIERILDGADLQRLEQERIIHDLSKDGPDSTAAKTFVAPTGPVNRDVEP